MLSDIVSIEEIDITPMMDIQVSGNNLFFANGILTHNSALDAEKLNQGHIQGGISKINTSDYAVAIKQDELMREAGEIWFEILKSRNSAGKGLKRLLKWDQVALTIESNQKAELAKVPKKSIEMPATGTVFSARADAQDTNAKSLVNLIQT